MGHKRNSPVATLYLLKAAAGSFKDIFVHGEVKSCDPSEFESIQDAIPTFDGSVGFQAADDNILEQTDITYKQRVESAYLFNNIERKERRC